ncbi:MAG: alpha/beta fold hydrolase [Rhodocyclaceae bacterium]|nr:alpha/beta fold hydrolase [Rhodocyclaceae bacterium]
MRELVLIPGWGFDHRVWQPVAERLAGDFRIGYDLDAAPAGAVVCGWSLGAMRALKSAVAAHLARVILVGATPRFLQAPDWPDAQPAELLDAFAAAIVTGADPRAALRRFAALLNQGDDHARNLTRSLAAQIDARIPDAATLKAGLAELRDTDLRKSVVAIRQRTLLVHGERDPLMPLSAARWLADHLPDARLEVFAGAAHAPFLSQPDRFADLVLSFANE